MTTTIFKSSSVGVSSHIVLPGRTQGKTTSMHPAHLAVSNRIALLARQLGVERAARAIIQSGGPDLTTAGLCTAYFRKQISGYACDLAGVEHWHGLQMPPRRLKPVASAVRIACLPA
ncbi:hypothetical protein [Massilia sp. TSP1-1-2]|uniref:hypothetical protein n=1 Tax=Massilia sp. TSP1-1-2 TaxID=2804649 RepID=UPI003CF4880B